MISDNGDIVRCLGFVTLYSAYLEEKIDELLILLHPIEAFGEDEQRWPISRKLKHLLKVLKLIEFETKDELIQNLNTCKSLFDHRNEVVHGRIYGGFDRPDTLQSGRANTPSREIESKELIQLANEFDEFLSAIHRPSIIKIPRAINLYLSENA